MIENLQAVIAEDAWVNLLLEVLGGRATVADVAAHLGLWERERKARGLVKVGGEVLVEVVHKGAKESLERRTWN